MARIPAAAVAALLSAPTVVVAGASRLPPNHPPSTGTADLLADFAGQLGCPYASEWLTKGPERASRDLAASRRRATTTNNSGSTAAVGSCEYTNAFTGQAMCVEFRGTGWTSDSMAARCDEPGTAGTLAVPSGAAACPAPASLAGWCVVGGVEASPLDAAMGSCNMIRSACETWMSGAFAPAGACGGDDDGDDAEAVGQGASGGNGGGGAGGGGGGGMGGGAPGCAIAPGPIGAAHQAGYSSGYSVDGCPGTPAEGSPYMWPLRWTADSETVNMAFGSDEVVYSSRGRVYYMLDRNWKRQDTHFQEGVLRTIGQMPCDEEDRVQDEGGAPSACDRNRNRLSTMLHRGGKMYFVYWKDGTAPEAMNDVANIEDCSWIDMQIVGNIRPDWYLDDRGDDTDTQYLGNQHVLHANMEARLVKQWRKKDFASQYFTMSMAGNPKPEENDVHWPLVLNIPGEGFGDDALRTYTNHATLTDDDEDLFLLDQLYEAAGGTCAQRVMDGEGAGGPPVLEEPIPSNLELDPNSWYSNVYTYSPVWQPPVKEESTSTASSSARDETNGGVAITEAGPSTTVESCYDFDAGEVRLKLDFGNVALDDGSVPWLALAFRDTAECLMTPRDGSDGEFVLVHQPSGMAVDGDLEVRHGPLPASAKRLADGAGSIVDGLTVLDDAILEGSALAGSASVVEDGESVELTLRRAVSGAVDAAQQQQMSRSSGDLNVPPEALHLTYAVGSSGTMGYHKTRKCFEVTAFPPCGGTEGESSSEENGEATMAEARSEGSGGDSGANIGAIVGGVLGGVAFVAIAGGVWYANGRRTTTADKLATPQMGETEHADNLGSDHNA